MRKINGVNSGSIKSRPKLTENVSAPSPLPTDNVRTPVIKLRLPKPSKYFRIAESQSHITRPIVNPEGYIRRHLESCRTSIIGPEVARHPNDAVCRCFVR
ncbi:hypothetical protein J6590_005128 [Homalodisca vitripennis]|nr:hypothetical protein J6590_005128 [Homalodisca vitripennis]